jgi:hypothetical protein
VNDWIDRNLNLFGVLLGVCCLAFFYLLDRVGFSGDTFSPIFHFLISIYDTNTAWLSFLACVLAAAWRKPAPVMRLIDLMAARPLWVAGAAMILLAVGTVKIYHAYPLCMDEYAPVFQAKLFAAGRIWAQLPPGVLDWFVVPGFNGSFLIGSHETGRVIEGYWPGFAALLAPFTLLGAPWLCNPVISGVALLLMYKIAVAIGGDKRAGGWAVLFALGSGAFIADGISFYSMQAHLTLNLLFVWLLLQPTHSRALAAGVAGSLALVLHNPLPHALFAAPWILSMLIDREQRRWLPALLLGYVPIAAGVGIGWLMLRLSIAAGQTGGDLVNGVFGWPTLSILNMRAAALAKMWVWAVPGLMLFAYLGARRFWHDRRVRLLAFSALLTFGAYLFVSMDQGHGWGYRYFHSAWGVLPVLAACALLRPGAADDRVRAFAGAAAVLSIMLVLPLQLFQINSFITRYLDQLPEARRPGNNVFFVDIYDGFYSADMVQFDPLLRTPDLRLLRRGAALDTALMNKNWPQARKVSSGYWGEQWYLGPVDVRAASPEAGGAPALRVQAP